MSRCPLNVEAISELQPFCNTNTVNTLRKVVHCLHMAQEQALIVHIMYSDMDIGLHLYHYQVMCHNQCGPYNAAIVACNVQNGARRRAYYYRSCVFVRHTLILHGLNTAGPPRLIFTRATYMHVQCHEKPFLIYVRIRLYSRSWVCQIYANEYTLCMYLL